MGNIKNEEDDFWRDYYNDDEIINKGKELHSNISRTRNGNVVSNEIWKQTINYLKNLLKINSQTVLLNISRTFKSECSWPSP